jgi:tol-pal system protein YbgF
MRILNALQSSVRMSRPLVPLLAAALVAGCATPSYGPPINGNRALSPEEQRLQAVETKLADLSRRYNSSEANRDQKLSEDLGSLRGTVEQLRHDLDVGQKRSQDQYVSLDGRLKALEAPQAPAAAATAPEAAGAVPVAGAAPTAVVVPAAPAAPPASAAADEESAYLKSFDLLKAQRYDEAIVGFKGMLAKYPQGNYSDNAWYWTGECYYIKKDTANALNAYRAVLEKFPASPKVPDALLKTGIIQQDAKKNDQARAAYQRLLKEFPNSTAAAQAKSRLAQLH